jgi:hypothetical protein
MKKLFVILGIGFMAAGAFAAFATLDGQDAHKTGLSSLVSKVNANFALIPASIATNVTAQTATVAGTVTLTYTTNIVTYLNADTNAVSWTNIAVTGVAVTTAGVTTNVSVQTKSP